MKYHRKVRKEDVFVFLKRHEMPQALFFFCLPLLPSTDDCELADGVGLGDILRVDMASITVFNVGWAGPWAMSWATNGSGLGWNF